MLSYTIHIFSRRGVPARIALEFEDDQEAMRTLAEYGRGHAIELWQGDRLVKRFEVGETRPEWPPGDPP